ncbi:MAG: tRNA epoxyqueuosine(34) reductase QueG [Bryobacteraceae bacterium]|nr:tRNA epoxyqueuosine(34) reductase QueG [Bryobacteraceae bacterium]
MWTESDWREAAARCGIDLIGVTTAEPLAEHAYYLDWVSRGLAAGMTYLTDHRANKRGDVREILPSAKSVIVAAVLYNAPVPGGPFSRYAWGPDYHDVLRERLERLAKELPAGHDYRVCVDTVPVLERALARRAGLGWIGKNTCLIHQGAGSWFFLGEILTSLELPANPREAPDRCGSCTRCIEACPTSAIVPTKGAHGWELDARLCISYHTIEARTPAPPGLREHFGSLVFGCDICQDVCPWNRRAPITMDFAPVAGPTDLEEMAMLTAEEFRAAYRHTPIWRAKHRGFLRNVAIAMGNAPRASYGPALEHLAASPDPDVREMAGWALSRLNSDDRLSLGRLTP